MQEQLPKAVQQHMCHLPARETLLLAACSQCWESHFHLPRSATSKPLACLDSQGGMAHKGRVQAWYPVSHIADPAIGLLAAMQCSAMMDRCAWMCCLMQPIWQHPCSLHHVTAQGRGRVCGNLHGHQHGRHWRVAVQEQLPKAVQQHTCQLAVKATWPPAACGQC
jgi:hypothetical protein